MSKHRYINLFLIVFIGIDHLVRSDDITHDTVESIQSYNIQTLRTALPLGWKYFCEADVDEGVIAFFPGNNPSDGTIHLITRNNETISLPIKYVSKVSEFGLNPSFKTIIYVNAFFGDQTYDIRGHLLRMQLARRDNNILVVDFAQDIFQLYNSVKHNVFVEGYFIAKLISTLALKGVKQEDIILIGHSVGANIAALGATLHSQEYNGRKVSTLIAIDPALMCDREDVHVSNQVADRVIVIHGENDVFSIREPIGTIDIYPNGNGLKHQPGCRSKMCSHVFPFLLFVDGLIERKSITAVKCETWESFRRGKCDYSSMVSFDFDFNTTNVKNGSYFYVTQARQPHGSKDDDLKYKRTRLNKTTIESAEPQKSRS